MLDQRLRQTSRTAAARETCSARVRGSMILRPTATESPESHSSWSSSVMLSQSVQRLRLQQRRPAPDASAHAGRGLATSSQLITRCESAYTAAVSCRARAFVCCKPELDCALTTVETSQAAVRRFSLKIRGCLAAIRSSASAGPSGVLRPCSQLRSVCTLIPMARANCVCVRPTNRRRAAISSPDSNRPWTKRLRTRAEIARASCFAVNSGMSVMSVFSSGNERGLAPFVLPTARR